MNKKYQKFKIKSFATIFLSGLVFLFTHCGNPNQFEFNSNNQNKIDTPSTNYNQSTDNIDNQNIDNQEQQNTSDGQTSLSIVTDNILAWFDSTSTDELSAWNDKAYSLGLTSVPVYATFSGAATVTNSNDGKTVYLDGTDNTYVHLSNDSAFTWIGLKNAGTGWTTEIWFKSQGSWINLGDIWSAQHNSGIRCRISSDKISYPAIYRGPNNHTQNFSIDDYQLQTDTWYHLVTTYDHTNNIISTYINGTLKYHKYVSWFPAEWIGSNIYLGISEPGRTEQRMHIGSFRLYKKPLSPQDVNTNYNAENNIYK